MAISTLVVALTARTTDFERSLKSVEKSLDRTSAQIESVGSSMSVGLTAPILALAGAAAKLDLDFSAPFGRMQAVLAESKDQVDGFSASVLKLAGQTAQAPKELAQTLYDVQSAGIRGKQSLEVLTAAAEAGAIGLGKTGTIAGFLASELQAYGPQALSAAQTTEVLLGAVQNGAKSADDLAINMGRLLPIAAAAGVPFNDLAAALTVTTKNGLETAQATAGLQAVLVTLEKPSSTAKKALAEMGLSAAGLRQELKEKGLLATLQTLQTAFKGNEEALTQVFPSARSLGSVLSLLGSNAGGVSGVFKDLADTTQNRLGKAMRTAGEDDSFKLQQALVQVQTALIKLGSEILPIIVPLVERFSRVVKDISDRFQGMDAGGRDLAVVMLTLVASVGPLLILFSTLYSAAATLIGAFRLLIGLTGLANLFSMAAAACTLLGSAIAELVGYFSAFGAAETISAVILPALAGSALLAAGLMALAAYLWISKWQELKTDMGIIVDFIEDKLKELNGATRGFMGDMLSALVPGLGLLIQMKPAIAGALGQAADAAAKAGSDLKTGFMTEMAALEKDANGVFSRMLLSAKSLASGIVGGVKGLGGGSAPPPSTGPTPASTSTAEVNEQITVWKKLSDAVSSSTSATKSAFVSYQASIADNSAAIQAHLQGMVNSGASSMGSMTAAFLTGKENLNQFVDDMIALLEQLIIKMLIFQAVASAAGVPFATGFVGGIGNIPGHADGGRPRVGGLSVVGEKGPELFVPDTSGTIIPNSALQGGGGTQVTVEQTVQISGLDLSSADAARRLALGLKEAARSGASEGVALSLQLAQTAKKNTGRSV